MQHTARHERLDTLCGDEFQGYRGVPCGKQDCQLNSIQGNAFNRGAKFSMENFTSLLFLKIYNQINISMIFVDN